MGPISKRIATWLPFHLMKMIEKHAEIQDFRIKHEFSLKLGNYGIKDWNCKNYRTLPQIT